MNYRLNTLNGKIHIKDGNNKCVAYDKCEHDSNDISLIEVIKNFPKKVYICEFCKRRILKEDEELIKKHNNKIKVNKEVC